MILSDDIKNAAARARRLVKNEKAAACVIHDSRGTVIAAAADEDGRSAVELAVEKTLKKAVLASASGGVVPIPYGAFILGRLAHNVDMEQLQSVGAGRINCLQSA